MYARFTAPALFCGNLTGVPFCSKSEYEEDETGYETEKEEDNEEEEPGAASRPGGRFPHLPPSSS